MPLMATSHSKQLFYASNNASASAALISTNDLIRRKELVVDTGRTVSQVKLKQFYTKQFKIVKKKP
jgi:hypothetical protein